MVDLNSENSELRCCLLQFRPVKLVCVRVSPVYRLLLLLGGKQQRVASSVKCPNRILVGVENHGEEEAAFVDRRSGGSRSLRNVVIVCCLANLVMINNDQERNERCPSASSGEFSEGPEFGGKCVFLD